MFGNRIRTLSYAVYTDKGAVRSNNEDNFFLNGLIKEMSDATGVASKERVPAEGVFAVCDGMGGEGHGEMAAYTAVCLLQKYQDNFHNSYSEYIGETSLHIKNIAKGQSMGCTLAAVAVCRQNAFIVNLGDSRIYLIRKKKIEQLSEDHNEFAVLKKAGLVREEDYPDHPARNTLTRYLGTVEDETEINPYVSEHKLKVGDKLLLCSDGLTGVMPEVEMYQILNQKIPLQKMCEMMIQKAMESGSRDNVTALLIEMQ